MSSLQTGAAAAARGAPVFSVPGDVDVVDLLLQHVDAHLQLLTLLAERRLQTIHLLQKLVLNTQKPRRHAASNTTSQVCTTSTLHILQEQLFKHLLPTLHGPRPLFALRLSPARAHSAQNRQHLRQFIQLVSHQT